MGNSKPHNPPAKVCGVRERHYPTLQFLHYSMKSTAYVCKYLDNQPQICCENVALHANDAHAQNYCLQAQNFNGRETNTWHFCDALPWYQSKLNLYEPNFLYIKLDSVCSIILWLKMSFVTSSKLT